MKHSLSILIYLNFLICIFWLGSLFGCATHQSYFRPLEGRPAPKGVMGTDFLISKTNPKSFIRIESAGIKNSSSGTENSVLKIRIFFENLDAQPWTVDLRQQKIILADFSSGQEPISSQEPILEITPGHTQIADLSFPLPMQIKRDRDLSSFTLNWVIRTSQHEFRHATRFERVDLTSERSHTGHVMPENRVILVPGVGIIR